MSEMPESVKRCVTHHHACDCREWHQEQQLLHREAEIDRLEAENRVMREALMKIITEQEKYNRGVMTVRSTEIAIRDAAKLLEQGE